jgi:multicomponent Na+:H+ antiporter subunit B
VAAHYLEYGPEEAGAENIVTDVILNYRGFDTQGEVTVIFTAMAAVLAVLMVVRDPSPALIRPVLVAPSMVVRFVVRIMAPFGLMFAVYVIMNGHVTPGGGFQGGTIAGAIAIALTLIMTEEQAAALIPRRAERVLQAAAPLGFVMVGLVGLALTGSYLGYPRGETGHLVTTVMLLVIEIGIGIGGATVIATIFQTMGSEQ